MTGRVLAVTIEDDMGEPFNGLLFHEGDRPQWEAVTSVWCDAVLVASAVPDERTTALWFNCCCRECGDRYGLTANTPYDGSRGAAVTRR